MQLIGKSKVRSSNSTMRSCQRHHNPLILKRYKISVLEYVLIVESGTYSALTRSTSSCCFSSSWGFKERFSVASSSLRSTIFFLSSWSLKQDGLTFRSKFLILVWCHEKYLIKHVNVLSALFSSKIRCIIRKLIHIRSNLCISNSAAKMLLSL